MWTRNGMDAGAALGGSGGWLHPDGAAAAAWGKSVMGRSWRKGAAPGWSSPREAATAGRSENGNGGAKRIGFAPPPTIFLRQYISGKRLGQLLLQRFHAVDTCATPGRLIVASLEVRDSKVCASTSADGPRVMFMHLHVKERLRGTVPYTRLRGAAKDSGHCRYHPARTLKATVHGRRCALRQSDSSAGAFRSRGGSAGAGLRMTARAGGTSKPALAGWRS